MHVEYNINAKKNTVATLDATEGKSFLDEANSQQN